MKLEVREIAAAMVGPSEPMINFKAASQESVTSLAQPIALRDVLEEMQFSNDSRIGTDRAAALIYATSTVVALGATQEPIRAEMTRLRGVG